MKDKSDRVQLSLRFDAYKDLLEQAQEHSKTNRISITKMVAEGLKLVMASQDNDFLASQDKTNDLTNNLVRLEEKLVKLEERQDQTSHRLDETSQRQDSNLTQEYIEELVDRKLAYLIDGMNQIKSDMENQIEFLKTEIDFLKQKKQVPSGRQDAPDRLPQADMQTMPQATDLPMSNEQAKRNRTDRKNRN